MSCLLKMAKAKAPSKGIHKPGSLIHLGNLVREPPRPGAELLARPSGVLATSTL